MEDDDDGPGAWRAVDVAWGATSVLDVARTGPLGTPLWLWPSRCLQSASSAGRRRATRGQFGGTGARGEPGLASSQVVAKVHRSRVPPAPGRLATRLPRHETRLFVQLIQQQRKAWAGPGTAHLAVSPVVSLTLAPGRDPAHAVCGLQVARSLSAGASSEAERAWSMQVLFRRGAVWLQASYERDPGGVAAGGAP